MEIDVQLSADGVPVLLHDITLDRTTNRGGPVRNATVDQLRATDAGDGEWVPTLAEVLQLVQGHLSVMCELKATPGEPAQDAALTGAVLDVIAERDAFGWSAIHSFNLDIVERARREQPRVSAAIISPPVFGEHMYHLFDNVLRRNGQAISVHYSCVTRDLVRAAKFRQLSVWAWTPDDPAAWPALLAAGVDGIITNVPRTLRSYLDTHHRPPGDAG